MLNFEWKIAFKKNKFRKYTAKLFSKIVLWKRIEMIFGEKMEEAILHLLSSLYLFSFINLDYACFIHENKRSIRI
jgi:hypothetical protein